MKRLLLPLLAALPVFAQCPTGTAYPAALDTNATLTIAKNNIITTLTVNQQIADTVAIVASTTGWVANMMAAVDTGTAIEYEFVTGTSGANTLMVSRACEGSAAVIHLAGAPVDNNATAYSGHTSLTSPIVAIETALGTNLSNIPGSASGGVVPVLKGGTGVTAAQGVGDTKVELAGTNSGTLGAPLCNDANGGATTTGCGSLPAGTQLQYLRIQPNTGNNTTNQFAAIPVVSAADYIFPFYSCNAGLSCVQGGTSAGSLVIGNNSLTLAPVPQGMNGTDTGHTVEISGGTGAAEACLITGGSGTSGAASGTIIINCANTHTGAWTFQTSTGGAQEAVCAGPSSGIQVLLPVSLTLNSNVSACGKTAVSINKFSGSVVTNGSTFTILGTFPSTFAQATYGYTVPNWSTLNTLYNGAQFDIGGYPDNFQNGFTTAATTQSLVGSINTTVNPPSTMNAFGVSGYGRTTAANVMTVGVYGGGTCAGANTQCWGMNADAQHDSNGVGGGAMIGGEFDISHSAAGAQRAATVKGVTAVILAPTAPTVSAIAFEAIKAATSTNSWNNAFVSDDNAAFVGLQLGHAPGTGAQSSQSISITANNGTSDVSGSMFVTSGSQFYFRPPVGGALQFDPKNTGSSTVTILSTGGMQMTANTFATISGAVTCSAGAEGTMWPVTDATSAVFNSTITGGGTNHGIAYCNGTNWVFH